MGSRHKTTLLDRARDELFSHVIRCDVLDAHMGDRKEWLADTMDFMAQRYPQLGELELAQLEVMGKRFIEPAIPHGSQSTASNRDAWQETPSATIVVDESDAEVETAEATEPAEPARAVDSAEASDSAETSDATDVPDVTQELVAAG